MVLIVSLFWGRSPRVRQFASTGLNTLTCVRFVTVKLPVLFWFVRMMRTSSPDTVAVRLSVVAVTAFATFKAACGAVSVERIATMMGTFVFRLPSTDQVTNTSWFVPIASKEKSAPLMLLVSSTTSSRVENTSLVIELETLLSMGMVVPSSPYNISSTFAALAPSLYTPPSAQRSSSFSADAVSMLRFEYTP